MNAQNEITSKPYQVDLLEVWRAGRTRRWHTHADLSRTEDYLDGHHARVAKLMLALEPSISRDALIAALTHDDGEPAVGDMSYGIKRQNPELYQILEDMEEGAREKLWGDSWSGSSREMRLLSLCDRLDSWLWVRHHEPAVLAHKAWQDMRTRMFDEAVILGVWDRVMTVTGML